MKNLFTILLLTCFTIAAKAQAPSLSYFSANQQTQLRKYTKFVVDSAAAVIRKEFAAADKVLNDRIDSNAVKASKMQTDYTAKYRRVDTLNARLDKMTDTLLAYQASLTKDSITIETIRAQVLSIMDDFAKYQLVETPKPMTADETAAFLLFMDKVKSLMLILNGKQ